MKPNPLQPPAQSDTTAPLPAALQYQHYFFVGCKGVGMTALAQCLLDMGKHVRGWDVPESFVTQDILQDRHIAISDSLSLPANTEAVVYSASHKDIQHPLVQQAQAQNLPIYSLADMTASLTQLKATIAVCGVGGKSTTSALLAWLFWHSPKKAAFLVGVGGITGLTATGYWSDSSTHFVVEADEYAANPSGVAVGEPVQPRFQAIHPSVCVCTQILHDHPDVYPSPADTQQAFLAFFKQIQPNGTLIINADDPVSCDLAKQLANDRPDVLMIRIGTGAESNVRLTQQSATRGHTRCLAELDDATATTLSLQTNTYPIELSIPGSFNLWNAAAAVIATLRAGVPLAEILLSLPTFRSTKRRLELRLSELDKIWYDDYAHHPSEIRQTLQSLRDWYPDYSLVVAFEPHTYSRTAAFLSEFAHSLSLADSVLLLPIFASARESSDSTISSADLVEKLKSLNSQVTFVETYPQAAAYLLALPAKTVIVTMGAGSIAKIYQSVLPNSKM